MLRERWDVVQQALQVYNLAKGYTRNSRSAALVAHVKAMKSALGRTGHPRRKKPGSDSRSAAILMQSAAVVDPLETSPRPPLPQSEADVRTEKAESVPSSTSTKPAKASTPRSSAPRSREGSSGPSRPHPVDQPHDAGGRPPEDFRAISSLTCADPEADRLPPGRQAKTRDQAYSCRTGFGIARSSNSEAPARIGSLEVRMRHPH